MVLEVNVARRAFPRYMVRQTSATSFIGDLRTFSRSSRAFGIAKAFVTDAFDVKGGESPQMVIY